MLLRRLGARPYQSSSSTTESKLSIETAVKGFAVLTVAASTLGYIILSNWLSQFGVAEPSLISTRLLSAGLSCLMLFVAPSLAVPFCFYYFKKRSARKGSIHPIWWMILEAAACSTGVLAINVFVDSIALRGPDSFVEIFQKLSALLAILFIVHLSIANIPHTKRKSILHVVVGIALLVIAFVVAWTILPGSVFNAIQLPTRHLLRIALLPYAIVGFFAMHSWGTRWRSVGMVLVACAVAYLPLCSIEFFGFVQSGWGGGQSLPVQIRFNPQNGAIAVDPIEGDLFFETDSTLYVAQPSLSTVAKLNPDGCTRLGVLIPKSTVASVHFLRLKDYKVGPWDKSLISRFTGSFRFPMGASPHTNNDPKQCGGQPQCVCDTQTH